MPKGRAKDRKNGAWWHKENINVGPKEMRHKPIWNGTTEEGKRVASGTFWRGKRRRCSLPLAVVPSSELRWRRRFDIRMSAPPHDAMRAIDFRRAFPSPENVYAESCGWHEQFTGLRHDLMGQPFYLSSWYILFFFAGGWLLLLLLLLFVRLPKMAASDW